jgi:hypothetical protein
MESPKKNGWHTLSDQYILVIIRGFCFQTIWWAVSYLEFSHPDLPFLSLAKVSLIQETDF